MELLLYRLLSPALLCCVASLPLTAAEQLLVNLATPGVLQQRLEAGRVDAKLRQATIADLFTKAGCEVTEQALNKHFSNVICTLPGETQATIIIGAHYDFVDRGEGIVDDWSGVALLPSLYEALKAQPRKHTYRFVAFAEEEKGLVGSEFYARHMTAEERRVTQAFVNLECLGLTPPKVWVSRSTPSLVAFLNQIAASMSIPLSGVNADRIGDDDTHPFLNHKLPVISIHSLSSETLHVLHSREDTVAAVHMDDYVDAYRLAAFYLALLDVKLADL